MITTAAGNKLGKHAPKPVSLAHHMAARQLLAQLPPAPETRDWLGAVSFPAGVMGNDTLGDCTAAGIGHWIQVATANNGAEVTPSDADVVAFYSGSTGYDPADPSTDQGGVEADVLAYAKKVGLGGTKIDGFAAAQAQNLPQLQQIVNTFGGAYIGLALPKTIEAQGENDGATWYVDLSAGADAERGSLGGHCVIVEAYDADGFTILTWGIRVRVTNDFLTAYNDETWALLANGLWAKKGVTPAGDAVPAYDGFLAAVA
jgi:hypothetical protein